MKHFRSKFSFLIRTKKKKSLMYILNSQCFLCLAFLHFIAFQNRLISLKDRIYNLLLIGTFEAVIDEASVRQFVQLWVVQVLPAPADFLLPFPLTIQVPHPQPNSVPSWFVTHGFRWDGVISEVGNKVLHLLCKIITTGEIKGGRSPSFFHVEDG